MSNSGLICAYLLDGKGGGEPLSWSGIKEWRPTDGLLWVHLDRKDPYTNQWIEEESGVNEIVGEALLIEETRPRSTVMQDGFLVILRGVNLNEGAEPHEMISIRCWFDHNRIITLRYFPLKAVQSIRDSINENEAPAKQGDFLVQLVSNLADNMAPVMRELDDVMDDLEEQAIENQHQQLRFELGSLRRQAIIMRRYIAPQAEISRQLHRIPLAWLNNEHKVEFLELTDQITRYVEELDSIRDRAHVVQDEIEHVMGNRLNRMLYYLSLVTVIFLPLTFVTGLLGINVGGIPGAENPYGFYIVTIILVVLTMLQIWFFHRLKLF